MHVYACCNALDKVLETWEFEKKKCCLWIFIANDSIAWNNMEVYISIRSIRSGAKISVEKKLHIFKILTKTAIW